MIKYLDVNKEIINAIFLLDGSNEEVREGINNIVEQRGEQIEKAEKKAAKKASTKKKEEKVYTLADEVQVSPKRRICKKLFKNKDYNK